MPGNAPSKTAPAKMAISTTINGQSYDFLCDPRQSLLEVLRDTLHLTGAKEGCNNGNCGACTVLIDGEPVNSCLVLAVEVAGKDLTTIEGIADKGVLHPLQQCFLEGAALQCGICTPGFIVAAKALLDKKPNPTEEEIRFSLAGNLCRCTGYDKIVRAVQAAAERIQSVQPSGGTPQRKQAQQPQAQQQQSQQQQ
ncbi:2Fe-2S iron-sulfur cluster binding domain-containing protein [bacterium]|nr:2Fe-2S iron-sulfur cluster binding domain-containing protein [bacterium]